MSPEERAQRYAILFAAAGPRWRECVPIDGKPHRHFNEMTLDGVRIAKSETADVWGIAEAGGSR